MNMQHKATKKLAVYGLGATGRAVLDQLLAAGIKVDCIIDRNRAGEICKDIQIVRLEDFNPADAADWTCLIALHNHYINIKQIAKDLHAKSLGAVIGLVQLPRLLQVPRLPSGYWLDFDFDYASKAGEATKLEELLCDEKSKELIRQIFKYRSGGNLLDCPEPSLTDEYTPMDLTRYQAPLRLIDCGAYTGVAIDKFQRNGYTIQALLAFEPDLDNFAKLVKSSNEIKEKIYLPLGTWSSNSQLRFTNDGSMGSGLDPNGASTIQCVRIDDIAPDFSPNIIKLDVEGAEKEALLGLEKTIKMHKPTLCVSVYHKPEDLFELPQLIDSWKLGYRFHVRIHEYNTFGVVLYCVPH